MESHNRTFGEWVTLLKWRWPTVGQGIGAILLGVWPIQTGRFLLFPGYTFLVIGVLLSSVSLVWGIVAAIRDEDFRMESQWSVEHERHHYSMIR